MQIEFTAFNLFCVRMLIIAQKTQQTLETNQWNRNNDNNFPSRALHAPIEAALATEKAETSRRNANER
jgi:hypothetical protein